MAEIKINPNPLDMDVEELADANELEYFEEVISLLQKHGYPCEKTDYGCIIGQHLFLGIIDLDYLKTVARSLMAEGKSADI